MDEVASSVARGSIVWAPHQFLAFPQAPKCAYCTLEKTCIRLWDSDFSYRPISTAVISRRSGMRRIQYLGAGQLSAAPPLACFASTTRGTMDARTKVQARA